MNLNRKCLSPPALMLAFATAIASLAAIPGSSIAGGPGMAGLAAKIQKPHALPSAGLERDPAFERHIDLELLSTAVREQDPADMADAGLQLVEGERILLRSHKCGLTASAVLRKAAMLAARKHDTATLERLARAAAKSGDKDLQAYLATLNKLAQVSRAADEVPAVSVDEMSTQAFALLKDLRHQLALAELLNDPARIKAIEQRMAIGQRLPAVHKEALQRCVAKSREGLSKTRSATDIALSKLASPSRDLGDLTNSQWITQYVAVDGSTINAQVVISGSSGVYSDLNGNPLGTLVVNAPVIDSQAPVGPDGNPQQVLSGTWQFINPPDSGTFEWVVSSDESSFAGTWSSNTPGEGSNVWNGQAAGQTSNTVVAATDSTPDTTDPNYVPYTPPPVSPPNTTYIPNTPPPQNPPINLNLTFPTGVTVPNTTYNPPNTNHPPNTTYNPPNTTYHPPTTGHNPGPGTNPSTKSTVPTTTRPFNNFNPNQGNKGRRK